MSKLLRDGYRKARSESESQRRVFALFFEIQKEDSLFRRYV